MAWVRTATSLISFGFTIYKFFQYLQERQTNVEERLLGPRGYALVMITIGIVALVLATLQHRRRFHHYRDAVQHRRNQKTISRQRREGAKVGSLRVKEVLLCIFAPSCLSIFA
jgi:uncharacterized membrane protein YidH (DUF202 family)